MSREKNLEKSLELLKDIGVKTESICAIKHFSAKEGKYEEYPKEIHPALVDALKKKGYARLYSHQHHTWTLIQQGKNAVIVTPTAYVSFLEDSPTSSLLEGHHPNCLRPPTASYPEHPS